MYVHLLGPSSQDPGHACDGRSISRGGNAVQAVVRVGTPQNLDTAVALTE